MTFLFLLLKGKQTSHSKSLKSKLIQMPFKVYAANAETDLYESVFWHSTDTHTGVYWGCSALHVIKTVTSKFAAPQAQCPLVSAAVSLLQKARSRFQVTDRSNQLQTTDSTRCDAVTHTQYVVSTDVQITRLNWNGKKDVRKHTLKASVHNTRRVRRTTEAFVNWFSLTAPKRCFHTRSLLLLS